MREQVSLQPIKKVFFLVHPFWGYYGMGSYKYNDKTAQWEFVPFEGWPIYATLLENEWHRSEIPQVFFRSNVQAKRSELLARLLNGKIGDLGANWEFQEFMSKYLSHVTPEEIEEYRQRVEALYKKAIRKASRKKDSVFVIISTPSERHPSGKQDKHSRKVMQKTHEYGLLKYAKAQLGRQRAIIIQERFKPVRLFQLLAGRGFGLAPNVEIEAFGEIVFARYGGKLKHQCVPHFLQEFVDSIPKMRGLVATGKIFTQTDAPPPKLAFGFNPRARTMQEIGTDASGAIVGRRGDFSGIEFAHRMPVRFWRRNPRFWVNLSRSGIPLSGIGKLAARLKRKRRK